MVRDFFPEKLPTRDYLSYYASRFNTVELMSTLYGPPAMSTVNNWYSQTPKDFIFAVKMPRKITHEAALGRLLEGYFGFVSSYGRTKRKAWSYPVQI